MDIAAKVRKFINENYYTDTEFADDESLLDLGIIDSTGILEVIVFLESEFEITVEDEEMVPENLDSIANVTAFVERKRA